ncbi:unnamed protein product, partial [Mesorhabditis spiculigera]
MKRAHHQIEPGPDAGQPEPAPGTSSLPPHGSWVFLDENGIPGFSCLWSGCGWTGPDAATFTAHFNGHRDPFFVPFPCQIVGCMLQLSSYQSYCSHKALHLHHARLAWEGLQRLVQDDFFKAYGRCAFPSMFSISYNGDPVQCRYGNCGIQFSEMDTFIKHVKGHLRDAKRVVGEERAEFHCGWEGCDYRNPNRSCFRQHMQRHTGEKVVACPYCGRFFCTTASFFDHMLRVAEGDLKCTVCDKSFASTRLLQIHHRGHLAKAQCPDCGVLFESDYELRRHSQRTHASKLCFQCAVCQKILADAETLNNHMTIHRDPALKCPDCEMVFRWRKQLESHRKREHEPASNVENYACDWCPKKYPSGTSLSRHLKSAHQQQVPFGFSRFVYKKHEDGFHRLQHSKLLAGPLLDSVVSGVNLI